MALDTWLRWLEGLAIATEIREGELLFPWIEAFHVLAITIVVGMISILDLRLLGLASRERPAHRLMSDILPVTWAAFSVAVVTGLLLFAAKAVSYGHNDFFLRKLVLLALAGVNMAVFHLVTGREVERWPAGVALPMSARMAGGISLALWVSVVVAGRWIGFTLR